MKHKICESIDDDGCQNRVGLSSCTNRNQYKELLYENGAGGYSALEQAQLAITNEDKP